MTTLLQTRNHKSPITDIKKRTYSILGEHKAYHYAYALVNIIHCLPIKESKSPFTSVAPSRAASNSLSRLSRTHRATIALAYSSAQRNISSLIAFPRFEALANEASSKSPKVRSDKASKDSGVARLCTWPPIPLRKWIIPTGEGFRHGTSVLCPIDRYGKFPHVHFLPFIHISSRAWACSSPQTVCHRENGGCPSRGSMHHIRRLNRTEYQPFPFLFILPHTSQRGGVPRG